MSRTLCEILLRESHGDCSQAVDLPSTAPMEKKDGKKSAPSTARERVGEFGVKVTDVYQHPSHPR